MVGVNQSWPGTAVPVMIGVIETHGAVEALYRSEGVRLWAAVRGYASDASIADDAVAEAFAQLLRRGDEVRSPGGWVWTTAFRIATRELQRRRTTVADPPETPYDPVMPDHRVLAAIADLSDRQRASIVLHYYADRPVKEIAEILGTTSAAVGVHLFRARKHLRQLLGEDV